MAYSFNQPPKTVSESSELLGAPAVAIPEIPDDVITAFQEESDRTTVAPLPEIERDTEFADAAIKLAQNALKNVRPAA